MSEAVLERAPACADCLHSWWHCHGTWVRHADGGECSDELCDVPPEGHDYVIACAEISGCCG